MQLARILALMIGLQASGVDVPTFRAHLETVRDSLARGELEEARGLTSELGPMLLEEGVLGDPEWLAVAGGLQRAAEDCTLLEVEASAWEWIQSHHESLDNEELALDAMMRRAQALQQLGEDVISLELLEELHERWSETRAPDDPYLLTVRGSLANGLRMLGRLDEAEWLMEELIAALEASSREIDPGYLLAARDGLADLLGRRGDMARSAELHAALVEDFSELHGPDHPQTLQARLNLVIARLDLEVAGSQDEELREILARLRQQLPKDHPLVLTTLQTLSSTLDDVAALALREELYELAQGVWPEDSGAMANLESSLAYLYYRMEDPVRALELARKAVAWQEAHKAPDDPALLQSRTTLGLILHDRGEEQAALEVFEEVYAAHTGVAGEDGYVAHLYRSNVAAALHGLGRREEALEILRAICERTAGRDHDPRVLGYRAHMARVLAEGGEFAEALATEEEVLRLLREVLPANDARVLRSLAHAAMFRCEIGDVEGAHALVAELLDTLAREGERLRLESPRVARAAMELHLDSLAVALSLLDRPALRELGGLEPELFLALESLRLAATGASRVALAGRGSAAVRDLQAELARVRGELNDLSLSPPEEDSARSAWRARFLERTQQRDRLERELRAELAGLGAGWLAPDPARIAETLPEDAALVTCLRYGRRAPWDSDSGSQPRPTYAFVSLLLRADGRVERVELGAAADVEGAVERWRAALGRPLAGRGVSPGVPARADDLEAAGTALRKLVLDPQLDRAGEVRTLYVVLDDALFLVPFDALPEGSGVVGDQRAVRLVTNAAELLAERDAPAKGDGLLVVGGVDYDARGAAPEAAESSAPPGVTRAGSGEGFEALPGTAREIAEVAAAFRSRFETEVVVTLEGDAATRAALAEHADSVAYLHVATHGWFAPEEVRTRAARSEAGLMQEALSVAGLAPETLCGLALAGANRGFDELGRVPGIMTAEELASLDLSGCELAVLSACETNVGVRRAGRGIQSLQSALHAAGARRSIASLWEVDDAGTQRLMRHVYAGLWKDGLGTARALWEAKRALRAEGAPTRDWAGWVLSGLD